MIGRSLAHYRVLAPIASGGMGEVYRARDTRLERDVAIKVLPPELFTDPDARRRLRDEALSLSRLQHPHIAVVHDFAEDQGVPFLVMELVDGQPLSELVLAARPPESDIRRWGAEIASALAAAHEQRTIHRDLKPANVMITTRGAAKVLDFGIAKRIPGADPRGTATTMTMTNLMAGTFPYMAPEQLLGEKQDARTDLFALGVVLYEMVTGRPPLGGETPMAVGNAILNETPVPPRERNPECSPGLEAIILRCLEKRPENRFATAADVERALRSEAAVVPVSAPLSSPAPTATPRVPVRPGRFAWLAGAAVLAAGLSIGLPWLRGCFIPNQVHALAVLPMQNLSNDPEQEYFVDGITDELIVTLSQVSSLKVISRSSSMTYKNTRKSAKQIARELNVDALVSGSVQRSGARLVVRAALVDASSERNLWAESFDRELTDILVLQRDVARAIVGRIDARLAPEEEARLAQVRKVNPESHEAYLRGRYHWHQFTPEGWKAAEREFERAIALDPEYAPAYAGLADVLVTQNGNVGEPQVLVPRAFAAVERAVQLDPDLAAALASQGYLQGMFDHDWKRAETTFLKALALSPSEITVYQNYGAMLHMNGRFDEASRMFAKAREMDPLSAYVATMQLWPYNQGRRHDEAIERARRLLAVDSTNFFARYILAQSLAFSGHPWEAAVELEHVVTQGDLPILKCWLGWAYARAGKQSQGEGIYRELTGREKHEFISPYGMAVLCTGLGRREEALAQLERGLNVLSEETLFAYVDPAMDPLRSEPRFQAALARMHFPPTASPPVWRR